MTNVRPGQPSKEVSLQSVTWGVFLLSLSLLLFELTLIRVYSAIFFYHFAFMAISVAMLGLAAAGLTVHLRPASFRLELLSNWGGGMAAAYALSVIMVFAAVFRIPINAYLAPNEIAGKLILVYLLSAAPFYLAGLVISGLFSSLPQHIGRLYAWDLVGAGLGAVGMLVLMNLLGGEIAGYFIAGVGLGAAILFSSGRQRRWLWMGLGIILILGFANNATQLLKIQYSKGAPLAELDVRYNRWNSFSRIMAIPFRPGTDAVYTWCPSPNYPLPIMQHFSIMIDDGASTPVLPFDGSDLEPISYLKYDLTSMGHRMRGNGRTLIIGSGGGRDVLTGLLFGAEHIDAVDINPLIFHAMTGPLAEFDGDLYHHPKVTPIVAEGRSFARRHPGEYDLIQVAMIDTWAATTSGAYALSENTLYTVEAFQDYLHALKPEGVLAFTRFFLYPPRQALRLVSLYLEAARREGIENPDSCIMVSYFESLGTLLFKKAPFTSGEIAKFKADLEDLGFGLVYAPDERPDKFFRALVEIPDKEEFYRRYPFRMSPTTDDKPFFFNMLKMKDFLRVFELREGQKFNYYATYTLLVVLFLSLAATVVTLVLPVVAGGAGGEVWKRDRWLLLYFIGIGLSYIMIEVALLQRFALLLEHPAYAASAVVAGMLISSGLGSLMWHRTGPDRRARLLRTAYLAILVMLLFHAVAGNVVIHSVIQLPLFVKMLIAAVLVLPLGFAMGIPLPAGITLAGQGGVETVAWCWALNGAASVVASSLAVAGAMAYGFSAVIGLGLATYLAAFAIMVSMLQGRFNPRATV